MLAKQFVEANIVDQLHERFHLWIQKNGIVHHPHLKLSNFQCAGRGILATGNIKAGEILVEVPAEMHITSSIARLYLESFGIASYELSKRSPVVLLCLFLMIEDSNTNSVWRTYLDILPREFYTAVFFDDDTINALQSRRTIEKVEKRKRQLKLHYMESLETIKLYPNIFESKQAFTFEKFKWAWSCVMTRSIYVDVEKYMPYPSNKRSISSWNETSKRKNIYALLPFLDCFNHANVMTTGFFNEKTRSYQIFTNHSWSSGDQVFISYGAHSNVVLLLEYGFTLMGQTASVDDCSENNAKKKHLENDNKKSFTKNPPSFFDNSSNDFVDIDIEMLLNNRQYFTEEKSRFLYANGVFPVQKNKKLFVLTMNSVCWNLLSTLRILFADPDFQNWTNILVDEPISDKSELLTWTFIEELCSSMLSNTYKTSIEEDNEILRQQTSSLYFTEFNVKKLNYCNLGAVQLRRKEKEIFQSVLMLSRRNLKELTK